MAINFFRVSQGMTLVTQTAAPTSLGTGDVYLDGSAVLHARVSSLRSENTTSSEVSSWAADTTTPAPAISTIGSLGTLASPAALTSGKSVGSYLFRGYVNGSTIGTGAAIVGTTTEAWGGSARGAKLDFQTVTNGGTTPTTRATIDHNGAFSIAGLSTDGPIYVSGGTGLFN